MHKDIQTRRGLSYHYVSVSPESGKPTFLFIHGFPSTSYDWRHQIEYFSAKGFGLIVPDMLGYGGTEKPAELKYYSLNGMSTDLIDILDAEHVDKAFAVGHDWGCAPLSRLSLLYSDRFLGFAWLARGFVSPSPPNFDLEELMAKMKARIGTELHGYWTLMIQDTAASLIENNIDSFLTVLYAADPEIWRTLVNIPGQWEDWIRKGKMTERAKYVTQEEYNTIRENILKGGLTAPLNWYKAFTTNLNRQDNIGKSPSPAPAFLTVQTDIPKENYAITKPAFFGAALKDYSNLAEAGKRGFEKLAKDLTVVDFDTGHWLQLEQPEKLNKALEIWVESKV